MKTQHLTLVDKRNEVFKNLNLTDDLMYRALISKDSQFEGVFFAAITTTGIFCRPTCSAKKPKPENVVYYSQISHVILDGYRPCKICKPAEESGSKPDEMIRLLDIFHNNPLELIRDCQLVKLGFEPATVRRQFQKHFDMTFHAYQRMYRLNHAFAKLESGESVLNTAMSLGNGSLSGFDEMFKNLTGLSPKQGKNLEIIHIKQFKTPLGQMISCATKDGICLLEFYDRRQLATELAYLIRHFSARIIPGNNLHLDQLEEELCEYFEGNRNRFSVRLLTPGTAFQQKVWNELQRIPYGTTRSYLEQSININSPKAVRAVANANGMNRIAIIIPCHRIIGTNGELRGYGGGVWRKRRLIALEQAFIDNPPLPKVINSSIR